MKRFKRNFFISLTLSLCFLFVFNNSVFAKIIDNRIYGSNRYNTAISISQNGWQSSKNVIIATGEDFPDALCAGPLANKLKAPIILVEKNSVSSSVLSELKRLKATNAYIIGGKGVVSLKVEQVLKNNGLQCTRISGKDRYETSMKIAKNIGMASKVVLTTGRNFPDALSIAPIASKAQMPILLVPNGYITKETKDYLGSNHIDKVYVIGGTGVITNKMINEISFADRISGQNRYETNCNIINRFYKEFKGIYLATGNDFPDALTGSVLAAKNSTPIMIVSNPLDKDSIRLIKNQRDFIKNIVALGGVGAVNDTLVKEIHSYIEPTNTEKNKDSYNEVDNKYNLYNSIKNGMKNCKEVVDLKDENQTREDVLNILKSVMNEYPYYGDFIQSYICSSSYVKFKYSIPVNEVKKKREIADKVAVNIINKIIRPNMSDLEKERIIHDYIVQTSRYDYSNLKNNSLPEDDFTTYGILVNHIGVCEGYAKSMIKLLQMANVECKYVIGSVDSTPHAWNIVKINGKYYHVDATFDDPVMNYDTNHISHNYFNINDSKISKDHSWDRSKYPLCN